MKIPHKLIRLTNMTTDDTTAYVRTEEGETESFVINSDVRQGDALSAARFNIAMEETLNGLDVKESLTTKEGQIIAYGITAQQGKNKIHEMQKLQHTQGKYGDNG